MILVTGRVFDVLDVQAAAGALALERMEAVGAPVGPVALPGQDRMLFFVVTRGSPADEDEWWSCGLDCEPESVGEGLRWHCRDSYVLAPPSSYAAGQGLALAPLAGRASAAGRAATARVHRRCLRGLALRVTSHSANLGMTLSRSESLFSAPARSCRAGELAGPRVRRGRRGAPVHGPRFRALPDRRGRARVRRPGGSGAR